VLEISNLDKYYGKFKAINDLNLKVKKGTVHGFLGPNGAGKTTAIRTILNILKASKGKISVFGKNVNGTAQSFKERIGYIPGDVALYGHMTVKQQLDYFASLRPNNPSHRMQEFVERFQLDVTKHNRGLSKGNRQKVALVQAFMHDPELYIFDEPSAGLDPLMQQELYQVIEEEVEKEKTFFISTHNLEEAQRLSDTISIIRRGEIVENMSVKELREKLVQKLLVEFPEEVDPKSVEVNFPGVNISEEDGHRMVLLVSDSLPDVLGSLSKHKLLSITIPEPMLEDYFMHFYEGMET
jgi:ABC-2 type transport system ATP-binding protein